LNKLKNINQSFEIGNINSLVELFFKKSKQMNKDHVFLERLGPYSKNIYTWGEVTEKILKFSNKIKKIIKQGDRCLVISENRPEWLIADIAIMNSGGISVPIFTTYSNNDYEYIIKDCDPSLVIVSNKLQYKKIEKYIKKDIKNIIIF